MCIYIYIYTSGSVGHLLESAVGFHIEGFPTEVRSLFVEGSAFSTANLRTTILDFRGFDSSRILILRGGIPMPTGIFLDISSQLNLVEVIMVRRLDVRTHLFCSSRPRCSIRKPAAEILCPGFFFRPQRASIRHRLNGYLVFFSPAVLGCAQIEQF